MLSFIFFFLAHNLVLLGSECIIPDGTAAKADGIHPAALTLIPLFLLHAADLQDRDTAELVIDPHPRDRVGVPLTSVRVRGVFRALQTARLQ